MANDVDWPAAVWKEINDAVLVEVGKVRTAQKILPAAHFDNDPSQVPDEVIDFNNLSIEPGRTKPFVEIFAEFTLTSTQVKHEQEQKTCKTLARMAAKALALAEDTYFFQSSDHGAPQPPPNTNIAYWRRDQDLGLLQAAHTELDVNRAGGANANGAQWGNNIFARIAQGISQLVAESQAGPYALVLPTEAYADTFVPPSADSLVTTAERIRPLTDGGFYTSPVLPPREGLLIALAGDPINLFVGSEARAEFVARQGNQFGFRVFEKVQYVIRDPRALVRLRFADPAPEDANDG